MIPKTSLSLSGDRVSAVYKLLGDEKGALAKAETICIEQTIEFPADLIVDDDIREKIFGRIEDFHKVDETHFEAKISYAVESSGFELTQFLNVIFGNSSIKPGIRVERLELPENLLQAFKGPRFGRDGLRNYLGVEKRPLLCTALKPMGLSSKALADYAYQFALGGIDMIKDDHGLADQSFSPFEERVELCSAAVARANAETGFRSIYIPNITAPANQMADKARFAKKAGAGGMMIAPGLAGFDIMRHIADDDEIALPILTHPALQGSYVLNPDSGISHHALFGQIARLAGADATIFPNHGGRFSFSKEECQSIVDGTEVEMFHLKSIFPAPGGGMSLDRLEEMSKFYGNEVIYLIGGDLHRYSDDLIENSRRFRKIVNNSKV
jgi:ribulose-bisphosphate carboxylase large chain